MTSATFEQNQPHNSKHSQVKCNLLYQLGAQNNHIAIDGNAARKTVVLTGELCLILTRHWGVHSSYAFVGPQERWYPKPTSLLSEPTVLTKSQSEMRSRPDVIPQCYLEQRCALVKSAMYYACLAGMQITGHQLIPFDCGYQQLYLNGLSRQSSPNGLGKWAYRRFKKKSQELLIKTRCWNETGEFFKEIPKTVPPNSPYWCQKAFATQSAKPTEHLFIVFKSLERRAEQLSAKFDWSTEPTAVLPAEHYVRWPL